MTDSEFQRLFDLKLAALNRRLQTNLGGLVLDVRTASARIGRSMRDLTASLEDIQSRIPDFTRLDARRTRPVAPAPASTCLNSTPVRHLRPVR